MPPINRVLEGVPDDLARVIQRLVIKDQARRYQSAKDALRDLRPAPLLAIARGAEAAAEAEAARGGGRPAEAAQAPPGAIGRDPVALAFRAPALARQAEARPAAGLGANSGHRLARIP